MTVWEHTRKGRIEGTIEEDHGGVFVTVRLSKPLTQGWETRDAGQTIELRKSFLTEVQES